MLEDLLLAQETCMIQHTYLWRKVMMSPPTTLVQLGPNENSCFLDKKNLHYRQSYSIQFYILKK